jgi:hypothetical protein
MDTIAIIRTKADRAENLGAKAGVGAVLKHLEMAERHFKVAVETGDDELFTDVIYRTNQVYEGMLREGYLVFAGSGARVGLKTHELENYLRDNRILKERVVGAMEHYRKKWRNPSTHEHVISFSESEALMAMLSVTSFVALLLDGIIERLVFVRESKEIDADFGNIQERLTNVKNEPLVDRLGFVLPNFGERLKENPRSEIELVAQLRAYLAKVLPNAIVEPERSFTYRQEKVRVDLYVNDANETSIIEIKRYRRWTQRERDSAMLQVQRYLEASGVNSAFILAVPSQDAEPDPKLTINIVTVLRNDDGRYVVEVMISPGVKKTRGSRVTQQRGQMPKI